MRKEIVDAAKKHAGLKKILLGLLPFWTPLIPPQGSAQLKVFLEKHNYQVKTVDANVEPQFKEIYQRYFNTLRRFVPESNWGNFYNIGHDVLRNHMMAHFNWMSTVEDEEKYRELVKSLIYNTYYWHLDRQQVSELVNIITYFYTELEKYILDLLEREKPDVFGLTAHLGTLGACMFSFKLTREKYPHVMTLLGGSIFSGELPTASPDFEFFLAKTPYIDKVVVGEGENLVLKILRDEFPGNKQVFTMEDIQGERLNISAVELPDLSDFELHHYPYNAAFVSRSCPHQCRFCSVAGFFGKYRQKNVVQAADQLARLYERDGFQLYLMLDSLVNPFITDLANELIKRDMSMYLDCYLRVSDDVCNPDNTLLWRRGGLYRTRLGIETGSQRVLKLMGKNITVDQSRAALANLAYAGIKTTAYFVIGFPGETEEDFQQTLDFLEDARDDIWEAECNPFYYYYTGQIYAEANKWADKRKLLYPGYARDFLITQTWVVDCEPSREERFRRLFRLVEHCKKLGIPNPYSWEDIYAADRRWENLHENAVPSMLEFEDREGYIDENKHVKKLLKARDTQQEEGDFMF
jgi:radical SAM superfamily enzyme YgiQ (UPF0313 family)